MPFGQGRYLNSIYQSGLTGINRVERIGSIYDSIYGMLFMTARGIGPFYGPDVAFWTNFYDIFPNEIQQIFTGMIAGRPEEYMPRLECLSSDTFPRCTNPRIVFMDFYRGDCSIDPATGEPRTETCRPQCGDSGRTSTATSKRAPRRHRTSFASAQGSRWKCRPRRVPRRRFSEVAPNSTGSSSPWSASSRRP